MRCPLSFRWGRHPPSHHPPSSRHAYSPIPHSLFIMRGHANHACRKRPSPRRRARTSHVTCWAVPFAPPSASASVGAVAGNTCMPSATIEPCRDVVIRRCVDKTPHRSRASAPLSAFKLLWTRISILCRPAAAVAETVPSLTFARLRPLFLR